VSNASKQARAERRARTDEEYAAENRANAIADLPDAVPGDVVPMVQSVALIADEGGYRLAVMALPADVAERYALRVTESEVLSVQLGMAMEALEGAARNGLDADGKPKRATCPACGVDALLRHPSKPVHLCASCDARWSLDMVQQ
jgi:hypothetical protein